MIRQEEAPRQSKGKESWEKRSPDERSRATTAQEEVRVIRKERASDEAKKKLSTPQRQAQTENARRARADKRDIN